MRRGGEVFFLVSDFQNLHREGSVLGKKHIFRTLAAQDADI